MTSSTPARRAARATSSVVVIARRASSSDVGAERDRRGRRRPGGRGAQRGAGRVERDVAAADDDDPLAELDAEALVHVEEVLDRAQHAVEVVAGQVEVAAAAGADREEQRGVAVEQLGDRVRLADPRVRLDVDAELEDRLDLAGDERAGKPVLGDAEHHHPAEPVLGLVDRHRMAGEAKVARGGEARPARRRSRRRSDRSPAAPRRAPRATSCSRRSSRRRTAR